MRKSTSETKSKILPNDKMMENAIKSFYESFML